MDDVLLLKLDQNMRKWLHCLLYAWNIKVRQEVAIGVMALFLSPIPKAQKVHDLHKFELPDVDEFILSLS